MTPITYRYILMGLKENPTRYIPRTPVQQEALQYAAQCMQKHRQQTIVTDAQMKLIVNFSRHKYEVPKMGDCYRPAIESALRAVNIEVKQYKHSLLYDEKEKWSDGDG